MSIPRTQEHRHWVQIEAMPNGPDTGYFLMDFNMIDLMRITRNQSDKSKVEMVVIHYYGTGQPLAFKGEQADWLVKEWEKFVKIQSAAPMATPGAIVVPDKSNTLYQKR